MRLPAPALSTAALLLFGAPGPPRVPPVRLCAPLTSVRYGSGTSLHVDVTGTRSVRRLESLPPKAEGSVRVVFVSDTHSQVRRDSRMLLSSVLCPLASYRYR